MQKKLKCIVIIILAILLMPIINIYAASEPLLYSNAAVAIDADSSIILCQKNANKKVYPASTTKILTAILAIENLELNKSIVASKSALAIPWDSSRVYIKQGESMTVEELLYCLLLNSGNDAANVLAEGVSGSLDSFVLLMNKKLKELGCSNTAFTNAHGYSDKKHYTTALDMAKILSYCIKNETFVKILSTKSYVIKPTNKTNTERHLSNTNRLIQTKEDNEYARYYKYCIGGKTGYTDESGRTLVTFAKKDGKTVIATIFGGEFIGNVDARYTDAINLFEYSFNNFSKTTLANKYDYNYNYINLEKSLSYNVGLDTDFEILKSNDNNVNISSYKININSDVLENVNESTALTDKTIIGNIEFNINSNDDDAYCIKKDLVLNSVSKISKITAPNILVIILIIILLFTIVTCTIFVFKYKRRVNKSRKNRR